MNSSIPFFNTYVDVKAIDAVSKVLQSTFLSEGAVVAAFEEKLSSLGLKNPVAVNSGTAAIHVALLVAGIGAGDEVILPAQTFIATALAVLYVGAIPVFADIQYETGNIDPLKIEKKISKRTKAIIPVHWAGYPCDMSEIKKIAMNHGLIVIEDAAHAFGATYKGKNIGDISPFTCFSFQAIKHLTTGDGGAVCTKRKSDADRVKRLRWFGIDRVHAKTSLLGERQYVLTEPGYKYHLNDYAAALGISNLTGIHERLRRRTSIARRYTKAFLNISGIQPFTYQDDRQSSWWLYGLHVEKRNSFIRALSSRGVSTSVVHQRIDKHPVFGGLNRDLIQQERFDASQIHLPVYDALTDSQVDHIISSVQAGW